MQAPLASLHIFSQPVTTTTTATTTTTTATITTTTTTATTTTTTTTTTVTTTTATTTTYSVGKNIFLHASKVFKVKFICIIKSLVGIEEGTNSPLLLQIYLDLALFLKKLSRLKIKLES